MINKLQNLLHLSRDITISIHKYPLNKLFFIYNKIALVGMKTFSLIKEAKKTTTNHFFKQRSPYSSMNHEVSKDFKDRLNKDFKDRLNKHFKDRIDDMNK